MGKVADALIRLAKREPVAVFTTVQGVTLALVTLFGVRPSTLAALEAVFAPIGMLLTRSAVHSTERLRETLAEGKPVVT